MKHRRHDQRRAPKQRHLDGHRADRRATPLQRRRSPGGADAFAQWFRVDWDHDSASTAAEGTRLRCSNFRIDRARRRCRLAGGGGSGFATVASMYSLNAAEGSSCSSSRQGDCESLTTVCTSTRRCYARVRGSRWVVAAASRSRRMHRFRLSALTHAACFRCQQSLGAQRRVDGSFGRSMVGDQPDRGRGRGLGQRRQSARAPCPSRAPDGPLTAIRRRFQPYDSDCRIDAAVACHHHLDSLVMRRSGFDSPTRLPVWPGPLPIASGGRVWADPPVKAAYRAG